VDPNFSSQCVRMCGHVAISTTPLLSISQLDCRSPYPAETLFAVPPRRPGRSTNHSSSDRVQQFVIIMDVGSGDNPSQGPPAARPQAALNPALPRSWDWAYLISLSSAFPSPALRRLSLPVDAAQFSTSLDERDPDLSRRPAELQLLERAIGPN